MPCYAISVDRPSVATGQLGTRSPPTHRLIDFRGFLVLLGLAEYVKVISRISDLTQQFLRALDRAARYMILIVCRPLLMVSVEKAVGPL